MPEAIETTIDPAQAEADLRQALDAPAETAPAATAPKAEPASQVPNQPAPTLTAPSATPGTLPKTDTPAAAATQPPNEPKTETQKADDKGKSEFSKSGERLQKTWQAVNDRKVQLDSQETTLKQREATIVQREAKFNEQQVAARRGVSPEQNEEAARQKATQANTLNEQAEAWEARKEKMEAEGDFAGASKAEAQAKELRKQSAQAEALADLYKANADHARKNPDKSFEQLQAQREQNLKFYTTEAAKAWPDLVKNGSEFQKSTVANIQEFRKQGLDENEYPVLRYYAAQAAALQTDAARVPELEKKLGAAEARVKELEALTAPGGGTGAVQGKTAEVPFEQLSSEAQEAWLRQHSRR